MTVDKNINEFARCLCHNQYFRYTPHDRNINDLRQENQYILQNVLAIFSTFGTLRDRNIIDLPRKNQCNSQDVFAMIRTFGTSATGTSMTFTGEVYAIARRPC